MIQYYSWTKSSISGLQEISLFRTSQGLKIRVILSEAQMLCFQSAQQGMSLRTCKFRKIDKTPSTKTLAEEC